MKQFENIFRTILVSFCIICAGAVSARAEHATPMDSIEIGLITCSPHEEVYSLYGHTAIRCHDLSTGADSVYNYGVFNFKAPHFVARFIFGLTDYELQRAPFYPFCLYYHEWGSMVTEQVLNLTNDEKQRLLNALRVNCQPENKTYRYNFFFDNCSTRPRNIIEDNIDGEVIYLSKEDYAPSFRDMTRQCTARHPWATFGNDILLGIKADRKATQRERQFLPDNLRQDFTNAMIERDGIRTPLVKEQRTIVRPGVQMVEEDFPLTPFQCALLLLFASIAVSVWEICMQRTAYLLDALLMLATGLAGCVLFVMIFSQHPATSINLQILVFNPLALLFIPAVIRKRKTRWFTISAVCIVLFFIGAIWQDYAEGMEILALILLLRFLRHIHDK